eukprot:m51a1_g4758 hypothetical protein (111) ;mRNA; f:431700-432032
MSLELMPANVLECVAHWLLCGSGSSGSSGRGSVAEGLAALGSLAQASRALHSAVLCNDLWDRLVWPLLAGPAHRQARDEAAARIRCFSRKQARLCSHCSRCSPAGAIDRS